MENFEMDELEGVISVSWNAHHLFDSAQRIASSDYTVTMSVEESRRRRASTRPD
jgi:hypothetical protein